MGPRDPTADELAVEYVLGELSRDEAETFERRVADDPELAEEVRRLRATLGLLTFATVTEPPATCARACSTRARAGRRPGVRARPGAWSGASSLPPPPR